MQRFNQHLVHKWIDRQTNTHTHTHTPHRETNRNENITPPQFREGVKTKHPHIHTCKPKLTTQLGLDLYLFYYYM